VGSTSAFGEEDRRAMTDNNEIARRVTYWRRRRGLSRREFAERVGRSVSWAEKIESGERALARIPMLERVAEVLQIDVRTLTDPEQARHATQCPDAAEVASIRSALGNYETATRRPGIEPDPDLAALRQQLGYVATAFLSSHFSAIGRLLPDLITSGQRAADAFPESVEAARLLVGIYRVASSTLLKFGAVEVAWLAADRAMTTARPTGDTYCLARATRCVARSMTSAHQGREALTVLVDMAARLRPGLPGYTPDLVSLFGMLLLAGEIAAARETDPATATAMHEEAVEVAARLEPGYADHATVFGVTNVGLHRVAALVRLGEPDAALDHAHHIDRTSIGRLPKERQATYLIDLAEAHHQTGHTDRAVTELYNADLTAPEEIRCRPVARQLITRLWEATTPSWQLRHLAGHAGLNR
jgi:Helix-turn-helix domain